MLDIDARQGLEDNFVERLKNILQLYNPGPCKVELNYKRSDASALIKLGVDWTVKPDDALLTALHGLTKDKVTATICYSD